MHARGQRWGWTLGVALGLLTGPALAPTLAHAAPPHWSTALTPEDEAKVIDEVVETRELDERARDRLVAAAAKGTLVVHGLCVPVDPADYAGPPAWTDAVEAVATVQVNNLSDLPVWLVDLRISGSPAHGDLSTVTTNLPFLAPHSQAELTLSCDGFGSSADMLARVKTSGAVGPLTASRAKTMAATPARFDLSDVFGNRPFATGPALFSLAAVAAPRVDDRETARLLGLAILARTLTNSAYGELLGPAGPEAAHGLVDAVLERQPPGLSKVLDAALAFGHGDDAARDEALARLLEPMCTELSAEARDESIINTLLETEDTAWHHYVVDSCLLSAADVARLIPQLPASSYNDAYPLRDLSGFIALIPEDSFQHALPALLGGEPGPETFDGGLRPLSLWQALVSIPPPERLAALEALVRPVDVEVLLPLLMIDEPSPEQIALVDGVTTKLDELPEDQRGAALLPAFVAAAELEELNPDLLERLFAVTTHDPKQLRPLALALLHARQDLIPLPAMVSLEMPYAELAPLFEGPLRDCAGSLAGLRRCADALSANPELDQAAHFGLEHAFLDTAAQTLALGDPAPEQAALVERYAAYGLDLDPINHAVCTRVNELELRGADTEAHMLFLNKYGPEHRCTQDLLALARTGRIREVIILFGILGALGLLIGGLVWARRRSRRLSTAG